MTGEEYLYHDNSSKDPDLMQNLKDLDEIVKKFHAQNQGRNGIVTGYVLFTASTNIADDGDMLYAYNYSVGIGTDMLAAAGLVKMATLRMDRDITMGYLSKDDDDD